MFSGVYTALITPFKNGKIDYDALEKILEAQIAAGIDGVVPMGTTGESPSVSHEEHIEFITKTVQIVNKRAVVLAGTGSNSTSEAIHLTEAAEKAGVDSVLVVNPYYNRPPQRGLVKHFEEVAKSVSIPVVLYNIPGRTGINFCPESIAELLTKVNNIKAIKEASGDITQMMRVIELCGDKLDLLSGDDNLLLPVLSIGGKGVVSVLSNAMPAQVKEVINLYNEKKLEEAKKKFYALLPLCRSMFYETNPIPVKAAMAMMGYCSDEIRLPLMEIEPSKREDVRKAFNAYGVKI